MYRLPVTAMVVVGFAILLRKVAMGTATIRAARSERRIQMWERMAPVT